MRRFLLALGLALLGFNAYADEPSVILIMVDGARPDVIEKMAAEGGLPNIRKHFIDGGTELANSFTPLSLTVPSWSTILTGLDIDKTGIKGNDTFNRLTKKIVNYLDWRLDILSEDNREHGRANRAVHAAGNSFVMDRFDPSEVFMTFFPLNDAFPMALIRGMPSNLLDFDFWKQFTATNAMMRFLYDFSAYTDVDHNSVERALAELYKSDGPKKKLVGIYIASVDHLSHFEHVRGRRALQEVDAEIGEIFEALRMTRYHDSIVVLMSDHGSLGGEEYAIDNTYNPLRGRTYSLTSTNLSEILGGWYNKPGYADYNFDVEAAFASEGKFSLRNLDEIQLQPTQCTNLARAEAQSYGTCQAFHTEAPERITAGVTSTQTISLPYASRTSGDWKTPNNWYTLTHYQIDPGQKNLIQDLEDFTLDNLMVFDSALAARIGNRPLDWLALRISKDDFNRSVRASLRSDEDVILLHRSRESEALILRKGGLFRYQPIRDFDQSASGSVRFTLGEGADPLDYSGNPLAHHAFATDEQWFSSFHTDRDWAERYADTAYPNVVFALPRLMSFHGGTRDLEPELRADLFLNPRYGHMFTVGNDTEEVNHGMWQRESVRQSFFITGPGIKMGARITTPSFSTDILPTALEAAKRNGTEEPKLEADGKALSEVFE